MPSSFPDVFPPHKEGCSLHANLSKLDMSILPLLSSAVLTTEDGAASREGEGNEALPSFVQNSG